MGLTHRPAAPPTLLPALLLALVLTSTWLVAVGPFGARPAAAAVSAPMVFAHRGSAGVWPENSLQAFTNTLDTTTAAGVDTDVQVTSDGIAVLNHEDTFTSRCTAAGSAIHTMTWAAVARVRCGGRPVPKAASLAALMASRPGKQVVMEIKTYTGESVASMEQSVDILAAVVQRYGIASQTTVETFQWRVLADKIRTAIPGVRLGALEDQPTYATIRDAAKLGADDYTIADRWETDLAIDAIAAAGMRPGVSGVDGSAEYALAARLGVRTIRTDDPRTLTLTGTACSTSTRGGSTRVLAGTLASRQRKYPTAVAGATEGLVSAKLTVTTRRIKGAGRVHIGPQGYPATKNVVLRTSSRSRTSTVRVSPGDGGNLRVYTTGRKTKVVVTVIGITWLRCTS